MLDLFWENLKGSSSDSGLYILEHFFTLFPEEVKRFGLSESPSLWHRSSIQLEGASNHNKAVMDAIDSGRSTVGGISTTIIKTTINSNRNNNNNNINNNNNNNNNNSNNINDSTNIKKLIFVDYSYSARIALPCIFCREIL